MIPRISCRGLFKSVSTSSRRYRPCVRYWCRAYHELSFSKSGEPSSVLEYYNSSNNSHNLHPLPTDHPPTNTGSSDDADFVKIEMLSAPWNPADKNTIQGKYPSPLRNPLQPPPSLRGDEWRVAGSEGWGRVVDSGSSEMTPGTYVTFGQSGMGTFRSSMWLPKHVLIPIARGDELEEIAGPAAASLFQLGGTALRMLSDFETLRGQNRVIVQNAGNSGVGWMVSQLAAVRNIRVISVVRRGAKSQKDFERMVEALTTTTQQDTNTTQVVAEEDLMEDKDALKELQSTFGKQPPRLAINAVGGPSASLLMKILAPGGTMVTYGGMSMQPVTVATSQLIFKDLKVQGYWHSRWMGQSFAKQKQRMVEELVSAVLDQNVQCPPIEVFSLSQIQDALQFESEQSAEAVRKKVVFDCRDEHPC